MQKLNSLGGKEKVLVLSLIVVLVGVIGYMFIYTPLINKQVDLQTQIQNESGSKTNIEALRSQEAIARTNYDTINKRVEALVQGNSNATINRQDFLIFLGDKTTKYGVDLKRFQDFGVTQKDGSWRAKFDVDLYGLLPDLQSVINEIEGLGIGYNVTGISLRRAEDVEWLTRPIDKVNRNPWLVEDEKNKGSVSDSISEQKETDKERKLREELEKIAEEERLRKEEEERLKTEQEAKNKRRQDELIDLILSGGESSVVNKPNPVEEKKEEEKKEEENKPLLIDRSNTLDRLRLHFTIEFVMFSDPSQGYSFSEVISQDDDYMYQIDKDGTMLNKKDIDTMIAGSESFIEEELTRLESQIEELETNGEKTFKLNEYKKYLLSNTNGEDVVIVTKSFTTRIDDTNYKDGYVELYVEGPENADYSVSVKLDSGEVELRGVANKPLKISYGVDKDGFDIVVAISYLDGLEKHTVKYSVDNN